MNKKQMYVRSLLVEQRNLNVQSTMSHLVMHNFYVTFLLYLTKNEDICETKYIISRE